METRAPSFMVKNLPVYGDVILAPMDGYSDWPFRSVTRRLGSAMSYTEFINARDILFGHPHLHERLYFEEDERPVVYQIFDDDPLRLLDAALRIRERNPDVIDVNMGCSARTVSGRGAGAGLLCTPHKIEKIFSLLSRNLDIPVTGKIRLGWDDSTRNYVQVARLIEENGGSLVAVHGRTKVQGYSGAADWDAIAEVKQAVRIPVIGNGDVRLAEDVDRMRRHTGCDAVMVGRAAIGNPWIFQRLNAEQATHAQILEMVALHMAAMLKYYGPELGLLRFRKHMKCYLKPVMLDDELRLRLLTSETPQEIMELLGQVLA